MALINVTNAKSAWVSPVVYGVLLILMGVVMAIFKEEALRWILIATGILMIVGNTLALYASYTDSKNFPVPAVIALVIGLVLVLIPGIIADVAMICLGIAFLLYGIGSILAALGASGKSTIQTALCAVIGVLSVGLGIYTFFHLDNVAATTMLFIGIFTAVMGVVQVVSGIKVYNQFH